MADGTDADLNPQNESDAPLAPDAADTAATDAANDASDLAEAETEAVIEAVEGRRIVVCCGSGGVGKTTVSAGLGLGLAGRGVRTVVVTIDPARRLATALGMEGLGDQPRRVPAEPGAGAAELWALQLDAKHPHGLRRGRDTRP